MSFFKTLVSKAEPQASDVATIQLKLGLVEQDIADAERELAELSLAAAISDDDHAGKDVLNRLADLRGRRELLVAAMGQAERAERDKASQQRADEFETRKRAMAQHLGAFQRTVTRTSNAIEELHNAFRALTDGADKIRRLLPRQMLDEATGFDSVLTEQRLLKLCQIEAWKHAARFGTPSPGCSEKKPLYLGDYKNLDVELGQFCADLKRVFDALGPRAIPAPIPAPTSTKAALLSAPAAPSEPPAGDYSVDLRGRDLGVPKSGVPDVLVGVEEEAAA